MKDNELVPALNHEGFTVSIYEGGDIEAKLNIKKEHDKVLAVASDTMSEASAELAYGITKTAIGMELSHYNKHCSRSEFALTYTLVFDSERLLWLALFVHVKRTSQILINLAQSNNMVNKRA